MPTPVHFFPHTQVRKNQTIALTLKMREGLRLIATAHQDDKEAAAAAAAAAAGPAKTVTKRRYKLLSVYPLLPPSMRREEWSLSQFAVEKRLHKGYASEVYKVRQYKTVTVACEQLQVGWG